MRQRFYSNGKLIITGEYVVLDGADAFSLPTKQGQDLIVEESDSHEIRWTSFDINNHIWFEDTFTFQEISNPDYVQKNDNVRNTLLEILHEGWLKNPSFLDNSGGYSISTHLTFPRNWGLGTSSTLINNIAQWLGIDAFELLWNSFGGSGYDIACAQNDLPLVYKIDNGNPVVELVNFNPYFTGDLYFIYLNKKQSSKAAIASYRQNREHNIGEIVEKINKITRAAIMVPDMKNFAYQLEKHESILSEILEMQTVKEALFPDFKGVIKSLGGWGGDFVLAVSRENPTGYFKQRGFETVIPYHDMILSAR